MYRENIDQLEVDDLKIMCSQLEAILMPTFCGNDISFHINRLDTKKMDYAVERKKYDPFKKEITGVYDAKAFMIQQLRTNKQDSRRSTISIKPNWVYITNFDKEIIDQYIHIKQSLDFRKINKLYVEVELWDGTIPEARESSQFCTYKDSLYLFGGIGSMKFDYFSEYDVNQRRWFKREPRNENYTDLPAKRFGHSLNLYSDYFVLFGGCGNYSEKTKVHESYNDIRIFDIKKEEWIKSDYSRITHLQKQFLPEKRMFHVAAVM